MPHNGTLYAARLFVDGFGGNANPQIERFGARAESGDFYPAIPGYSNLDKLYFDVVGPVPNSVVWNDGIRDILAWIPGEPLTETNAAEPRSSRRRASVRLLLRRLPYAPAPTMPTENDAAIVATPNDLASPTPGISEAEAAMPGFNADGGAAATAVRASRRFPTGSARNPSRAASRPDPSRSGRPRGPARTSSR